jgi:hypothetical protein
MLEDKLENHVVDVLYRKRLDPVKVDNPRNPGTPDLNYIEGWIELKVIPNWPKRRDTLVRVDHFTSSQKIWLYNRSVAGGRADLLLQVGAEYLVIQGNRCLAVGSLDKEDLIQISKGYFKTLRDMKGGLLACLRQRQTWN